MDFVRRNFGKMNLWPVEHFFSSLWCTSITAGKVRTFMRSTHNLKKIFLMVLTLISKSADLSKPWGRFFQILWVSQKVRTLMYQNLKGDPYKMSNIKFVQSCWNFAHFIKIYIWRKSRPLSFRRKLRSCKFR